MKRVLEYSTCTSKCLSICNGPSDCKSCNFVNFLSDCTTATAGLASLGAKTKCAISDSCTNVHCCLQSDTIQETLDAYIDVDICNGKIEVGIEKFHWSDRLLGYEYGTVKHVSMLGLVNIE